MKKRFGEVLLDRELITVKQLVQALELQQRRGLRLGNALVALGALSETDLIGVLGEELGFDVVDLSKVQASHEAIRLVPHQTAAEHDLLPLELTTDTDGRRTLTVAMADPTNLRLLDELGFVADAVVVPMLATASSIQAAVEEHYAPIPLTERKSKPPPPSPSLPPDIAVVIGRPSSSPPPSLAQSAPLAEPASPHLDGSLPFAIPEEVYTNPRGLDPSRAAIVRTESGRFATNPASLQDFYGYGLVDADGGVLQADDVRELERKFWALLRVLVKKGLITKDELLEEIDQSKS